MPGVRGHRSHAKKCAADGGKRGKPLDDSLGILASTSPQKRLIEPEEVAHLALMLASESAKGITGQAINVDGGAVMV
jgi:NAD(P)-dependent dehydrogenase (short-subunit alcohol dehydrogenase family)